MITQTDTLRLTRPNSLAVALMILGNVIPLVGVIWWGWTVASVLVLYWVETVIIGLMNIPRIMATKDSFGIKVFISIFFMVHFGGFCFGHAFFLRESFNAKPEFTALLSFGEEMNPLVISAAAFFASHLFGLIISFFGPVKYKDRDANLQMFTPYGRIIIMQFTVLMGGGFIIMLGSPLAAIIILILLKTGLDWTALKLAEKYTLLLSKTTGDQMKNSQKFLRGLIVASLCAFAPLSVFSQAAFAKPPKALYDGSVAYEQGNYAQALTHWQPLVALGNVKAQLFVGNLYAKGQGVIKSDEMASNLYRKAAIQGFAPAQFALGLQYSLGLGVTKSDTEAVYWLRKAVEQGHRDAQLSLGFKYEFGKGVTQSDTQSAHWFLKAAEQGQIRAQAQMGRRYLGGRGVAQSDIQAVYWFRKAADQGHAISQTAMGALYAAGRGVPKSIETSVIWLKKAAAQGNEDAKEMLDALPVGYK